jgi:hypothetical protein
LYSIEIFYKRIQKILLKFENFFAGTSCFQAKNYSDKKEEEKGEVFF